MMGKLGVRPKQQMNLEVQRASRKISDPIISNDGIWGRGKLTVRALVQEVPIIWAMACFLPMIQASRGRPSHLRREGIH